MKNLEISRAVVRRCSGLFDESYTQNIEKMIMGGKFFPMMEELTPPKNIREAALLLLAIVQTTRGHELDLCALPCISVYDSERYTEVQAANKDKAAVLAKKESEDAEKYVDEHILLAKEDVLIYVIELLKVFSLQPSQHCLKMLGSEGSSVDSELKSETYRRLIKNIRADSEEDEQLYYKCLWEEAEGEGERRQISIWASKARGIRRSALGRN